MIHEASQLEASSCDLQLEEVPSMEDVDARAAADSAPSPCTVDAEERRTNETEDAVAATMLALFACDLDLQQVSGKEDGDARVAAELALSPCDVDLEKVPRKEGGDGRVASCFGRRSCALDVESDDGWSVAGIAPPPELPSNEGEDTLVLANAVSPVPPGPSGSPVMSQQVASHEQQGSGLDTHPQEQTGKTSAGLPRVDR